MEAAVVSDKTVIKEMKSREVARRERDDRIGREVEGKVNLGRGEQATSRTLSRGNTREAYADGERAIGRTSVA